MKKLLPFLIVLVFILGCANSRKESPAKPPTDLQKREAYARRMSDNEPAATHIRYSARGENKDILEINILQNIPRMDASEVAGSLADNKIKNEARALGFVEIHVKGGSRSFTEPDTIDHKYSLR